MAKGWVMVDFCLMFEKVGEKMMTKLNWMPLTIKETAEMGHEFAKFGEDRAES